MHSLPTSALRLAMLSLLLLLLVAVLCPAVASSLNASCSASALPLASSLDAARDLHADPCVSFYQYACGSWLNSTAMPAEELRYSRSFSSIRQDNQRTLRHVKRQTHTACSSQQPLLLSSPLRLLPAVAVQVFESGEDALLTAFYHSCMNQSAIDRIGIAPLLPYLQLFSPALPSMSRFFHSLGLLARDAQLQPLLSLSVEIDSTAPERHWLVIGQPSLSLPSLSLYSDKRVTSLLAAHVQHIFMLAGTSPERAALHASRVVAVETMLANISLSPLRLRDPVAAQNPATLRSLQLLAPRVRWTSLFAGLGLRAEAVRLNVMVPSYLSSLSSSLLSLPHHRLQSLLSSYTRWRILHLFAPDLSAAFQGEDFGFFNAQLQGQQSIAPRWQRCVDRTVAHMQELSSVRYQQALSDSSSRQQAVRSIIASVRLSLRQQLSASHWADAATLRFSLHKLDGLLDNVGGASNSSVPAGYASLRLSPSALLSNLLRLRRVDADSQYARLSQPADRRRWQMSAAEVNAYYEPTTNSVNFPFGILNAPFFDPRFPPASNYGALGMVVGHELSHAFDDQGRLYDATGRLVVSGSSSSQNFTSRAQCFVRQYSNATVRTCHGVEHVSGALTLGENLADNVGLRASFFAWQHGETAAEDAAVVDCLQLHSVQQLFFLSFATSWCQLVRPQYAHHALSTDVHSPAAVRVDETLRNSREFAAAFNCPAGSPMHPMDICRLY